MGKVNLSGLNEEQYQAVCHRDGPLLILAGAGSGKTRVITTRIAYLIDSGVGPYNILAVTFTNKAAAEMRERAVEVIGARPKFLTISTFHSFCMRVLKGDIHKLGYKNNFTIYATNDVHILLRNILREMKVKSLNYDEKLFAWYIDKWKNQLLSPNEITPTDDVMSIAARCYALYQEYLKAYNAVDFNDLINLSIKLFIEHPDVLEKYQERFRYIMIDEYQDTNHAQYKLTTLLADKYKNIVVVGDDDQSIYAFRGADVTNILSFETDYHNAKIITLNKNYRSTKYILDTANAVIRNNTNRRDKNLTAVIGEGKPPEIVMQPDENEEALFVATNIMQKAMLDNAKYHDFAILFRMNAQSRLFEQALRQNNIGYTVVDIFQFFDRKEIKDILAYLNLFTNYDDEVSILRVINIPKRGIGSATINRIHEYSRANNLSLYEALYNVENIDNIPENARKGVREFVELIEKYRYIFAADKDDIRLSKLFENVDNFIDEIVYYNELMNTADTKEKYSQKIDNVKSLLDDIAAYEKNNKRPTLKGYLDKIMLQSKDEKDEEESNKNKVTLLSVHSSKGLEFPYVYLVGMEDNVFPHIRSHENDGVEEERRLCYVAITRAKRELTITYPLQKTRMGKTTECMPSRFLEEMSSVAVLPEDVSEEEGFEDFKKMMEAIKQREMES